MILAKIFVVGVCDWDFVLCCWEGWVWKDAALSPVGGV